MMRVPNKFRVREGKMASNEAIGNNGAFIIPPIAAVNGALDLNVIASSGSGWEHVSVSTPYRTPTWDEMCYIKGIFWEPEDVVVQYHPKASEYVNRHPYCLHLWAPLFQYMPTPPAWMVG